MFRIDNATAAAALPTPAAVGPNPDSYFTDGDAGLGTPATVVDADWANAVQEELAGAVEAAGLTLNKTDDGQLAAAIPLLAAIRQRVSATSTSEIDISASAIPFDNSKPQIGEGTQILSASITPKKTTGKIAVKVSATVYSSGSQQVTLALFVNGGSDAIAVATSIVAGVTTITMLAEYTHGSVSAQSFTVRAGPQTVSGTQKVNEATYNFGSLSRSVIELHEVG